MGHTPDAKKGIQALTSGNEDILTEIATYSDIAMAEQEADWTASLEMIKKRHANELKAAKRNHRHRAKKIRDRMKYFEDMDHLELARTFANGVNEDVMVLRITVYSDFDDRCFSIDPKFMQPRKSGKSLIQEEHVRKMISKLRHN